MPKDLEVKEGLIMPINKVPVMIYKKDDMNYVIKLVFEDNIDFVNNRTDVKIPNFILGQYLSDGYCLNTSRIEEVKYIIFELKKFNE